MARLTKFASEGGGTSSKNYRRRAPSGLAPAARATPTDRSYAAARLSAAALEAPDACAAPGSYNIRVIEFPMRQSPICCLLLVRAWLFGIRGAGVVLL